MNLSLLLSVYLLKKKKWKKRMVSIKTPLSYVIESKTSECVVSLVLATGEVQRVDAHPLCTCKRVIEEKGGRRDFS